MIEFFDIQNQVWKELFYFYIFLVGYIVSEIPEQEAE